MDLGTLFMLRSFVITITHVYLIKSFIFHFDCCMSRLLHLFKLIIYILTYIYKVDHKFAYN